MYIIPLEEYKKNSIHIKFLETKLFSNIYICLKNYKTMHGNDKRQIHSNNYFGKGIVIIGIME